tara:strand:- start:1521 stop:1709 length:189 start_codon:yes stop_codon:yes gene_type:complete
MAKFLDKIPAGSVAVERSPDGQAIAITLRRLNGDPAICIYMKAMAARSVADRIYQVLRGMQE